MSFAILAPLTIIRSVYSPSHLCSSRSKRTQRTVILWCNDVATSFEKKKATKPTDDLLLLLLRIVALIAFILSLSQMEYSGKRRHRQKCPKSCYYH